MNKDYILNLSMFSHELKSPLNNILNLAKLIELNLGKQNEEMIKKYLSHIISQAIFMRNYISNTIEFGKIQSGKEELIIEEFDILESIYEIVELTKILIENKPIEIRTEFAFDKYIVLSDSVKIKQILLNISSNSVKFTKEGYIFFGLQEINNNVLIRIQDTGRGIAEEELSKILNHPYYLDISIYKNIWESSGLGLFITNQLLKMLGGSISIKSEYGKGTTVYISIPRRYKKS
ncbi:MAG: HAMP domain-containing sensor histidine kinase [Thermodesulfovibrio sp.]|nr:HAMP domain-containing histidine kinase [Thermodesulfovibrio sp.]MDW7998173.1 HAMP domain-containing sensor histidine kinase [Thermodesulfovibrio sp.]